MHPHIIEYAVFGDRRVLADERTEILLCQLLMNQRFTWSGSGLTLYLPFDGRVLSSLLGDAPLRAAGRTRVYDDDWNAMLVLRFLAWVSTRLAGFAIRVHDDSGFLSRSDIMFVNGSPYVVEPGRTPAFSRAQKVTPDDSFMERAATRIEGRFYERVPAGLYANVPEIAAAPISREELAAMTLDDIADRMLFPWDTERLGKIVPHP